MPGHKPASPVKATPSLNLRSSGVQAETKASAHRRQEAQARASASFRSASSLSGMRRLEKAHSLELQRIRRSLSAVSKESLEPAQGGVPRAATPKRSAKKVIEQLRAERDEAVAERDQAIAELEECKEELRTQQTTSADRLSRSDESLREATTELERERLHGAALSQLLREAEAANAAQAEGSVDLERQFELELEEGLRQRRSLEEQLAQVKKAYRRDRDLSNLEHQKFGEMQAELERTSALAARTSSDAQQLASVFSRKLDAAKTRECELEQSLQRALSTFRADARRKEAEIASCRLEIAGLEAQVRAGVLRLRELALHVEHLEAARDSADTLVPSCGVRREVLGAVQEALELQLHRAASAGVGRCVPEAVRAMDARSAQLDRHIRQIVAGSTLNARLATTRGMVNGSLEACGS